MNNNNIPQGYKDSPLGIIPKEWEVKKIKNILSYIGGGAFSSKDSSPSGVRWLKIANVGINEIKWDDETFLPSSYIDDYPEYLLHNGDIVLALTRPILDKKLKIAIISENDTPSLLNQRVAKIEMKHIGNKMFFYYYLQMSRFIAEMESDMLGTDPPNASFESMYQQQVVIPPLPEQQKIAEFLSVWDEAITKQTQLIAQLETRKRGLMQQLLTGKKRVKGFSGKWKKVKIDDIGEISSAGVDKKIVEGEKSIRLLNYLDVYRKDFIYSKDLNHWVTASCDKINKCYVKKGDIFFTPSSEVPNDIGVSAIAMEDMNDVVYSYHVVRLRLNEDWDLKYRAYAFKTDDFFKQAETCCDGSGQRYVISQSNFRKMIIKVPSIEEQTAIANILFTADAEIALAKKKLASLKEQKKGLMQVLLTGKKRVKI